MMHSRSKWWSSATAVALVAAAVMFSCGDDDSPTDPGNGGGGGGMENTPTLAAPGLPTEMTRTSQTNPSASKAVDAVTEVEASIAMSMAFLDPGTSPVAQRNYRNPLALADTFTATYTVGDYSVSWQFIDDSTLHQWLVTASISGSPVWSIEAIEDTQADTGAIRWYAQPGDELYYEILWAITATTSTWTFRDVMANRELVITVSSFGSGTVTVTVNGSQVYTANWTSNGDGTYNDDGSIGNWEGDDGPAYDEPFFPWTSIGVIDGNCAQTVTYALFGQAIASIDLQAFFATSAECNQCETIPDGGSGTCDVCFDCEFSAIQDRWAVTSDCAPYDGTTPIIEGIIRNDSYGGSLLINNGEGEFVEYSWGELDDEPGTFFRHSAFGQVILARYFDDGSGDLTFSVNGTTQFLSSWGIDGCVNWQTIDPNNTGSCCLNIDCNYSSLYCDIFGNSGAASAELGLPLRMLRPSTGAATALENARDQLQQQIDEQLRSALEAVGMHVH